MCKYIHRVLQLSNVSIAITQFAVHSLIQSVRPTSIACPNSKIYIYIEHFAPHLTLSGRQSSSASSRIVGSLSLSWVWTYKYNLYIVPSKQLICKVVFFVVFLVVHLIVFLVPNTPQTKTYLNTNQTHVLTNRDTHHATHTSHTHTNDTQYNQC